MSEQPAAEPVNIRILDREYTVGVNAEERASLLAAARLLDDKMRELRGDNRVASVERVAVLAALNLAHELEILRSENSRRSQRVGQALDTLEKRIEQLEQG
ncbi:MAG: cell division protein ZapA [Pseudomonadota bacterium]|nr:cell division protein ZapA [Pseudomonadota bacterium]